jgi:hypothetical protein
MLLASLLLLDFLLSRQFWLLLACRLLLALLADSMLLLATKDGEIFFSFPNQEFSIDLAC